MKKINFAGGEPFINPKFLGELVKFCKEELKLESVSIVSNGSLIKEKWLEKYGTYLDILAISCDSFNEEVNEKIGRGAGKESHIDIVS
jgi:radical S-adenosyl methionine domain-containing protein 2